MSIPGQFGRYRVLAHLATGGMAQVFVARLEGPARFQRTVAIKRVLPHLLEDARFREMFLDEARVTASIRHPAVAEVYDLVAEDEVYLVMEYVPGETVLSLARTLRKQQLAVPWPIAAHLVAEASAGLHAAHSLRVGSVPQPVIHRDVSPHNILITYEGEVKVIDFGIAKMRGQEGRTQAGEVKGKFAYMAPEQARGQELDARTDVFCLGIILWELLTGTRLFARHDDVSTLHAVLHDDIIGPAEREPSVPAELDRIVRACLSRDLDARPESAEALRTELESVLAAHGETSSRSDLTHLMRTLFDERMVTKELLVQGELPIGRVPSLASPTITELSVTTPPALAPTTGTHATSPRRRVPLWVGAGVAFALPLVWVGTSGAPDGLRASPAPSTRIEVASPAPTDAPPAAEARVATLVVNSDPVGAEVFLDGSFLGITPLRWSHDAARSGTLLMRHEGHHSAEQAITVAPGETVTVDRSLTPTRPVFRAGRNVARRPVGSPPAAIGSPTPAPPSRSTTDAERAPSPDYFRFE